MPSGRCYRTYRSALARGRVVMHRTGGFYSGSIPLEGTQIPAPRRRGGFSGTNLRCGTMHASPGGETGDASDLKSLTRKGCGFEFPGTSTDDGAAMSRYLALQSRC